MKRFLHRLLSKVDDDAKEIVISFEPSTKRIKESEIRRLKQGKDVSYVRGTVSVKYLIDRDFGFFNYKIYGVERNVSLGRFEREVANQINDDLTVDGYDFKEVFPSY